MVQVITWVHVAQDCCSRWAVWAALPEETTDSVVSEIQTQFSRLLTEVGVNATPKVAKILLMQTLAEHQVVAWNVGAHEETTCRRGITVYPYMSLYDSWIRRHQQGEQGETMQVSLSLSREEE